MSADFSAVRADFPALHQTVHGKPLVYLDNAATTHKPQAVIDALAAYYERDNSNVHRGLHALSMRSTDSFEAARARAARFVNAADPAEIIFTRGTTEGINLVAQSWGPAHLKAGDVILATEMEHHSNLVPWQRLAVRTGATLRLVPVAGADAEHGLDLDALERLLTPQVKLFAFTHISNTLGTINPAADLCARARRVGALTVVDARCSAAISWLSPATRWPAPPASGFSTAAAPCSMSWSHGRPVAGWSRASPLRVPSGSPRPNASRPAHPTSLTPSPCTPRWIISTS